MARCKHDGEIQQYTEVCMKCWRNIYETDEDYLKHLLQLKRERDRDKLSATIEALEAELGIKH